MSLFLQCIIFDLGYIINFTSVLLMQKQLDCPSVTSWDLVGTTSQLAQISNLRPFLDSSAQTTRGNVLDFFVKPKNGLV